MMAILLPLIAVLFLVLAANIVEKNDIQTAKDLFSRVLALLNLPLVVLGILLVVRPQLAINAARQLEIPGSNPAALGFILTLVGAWGVACSFASFRRILARALPIDSNSSVHMLALLLAGYLIGNTALALSQEYIEQLVDTDLAVTTLDIVAQQIGFVLLAYVGSGLAVRRNLRGVNERLGLVQPTWRHIAIGTSVIVLLILIQGTVGAIWALLAPQQAEELGALNEALLTGFDTVGEWLVLALASGFGEEILFRGALQPVFGLPVTALLFAVVHIQYGLTPITIVVFVLGLILGLVRQYTNTTVAIYVHFGYNFVLGLLSLLAQYLQQFVTF